MFDPATVRKHLQSDTGRLAATYLAIIMGLTIVFTVIIYAISSSQFDRPLPPRMYDYAYGFNDDVRSNLQSLFDERADQARQELFFSLLWLNIAVGIGGALFSYILARKTLEPIESAMQAQSQFVSDASHELRTPLTALQVTNEVALRKKRLTLDSAKELIGHNLAEVLKLQAITESLLQLARQDVVVAQRETIAVSAFMDDLFTQLHSLAKSRHIKLTATGQGTITTDAAAVRQILTILTDNAIKYAPERTSVAMTFSDQNDGYRFDVHNDGPVIPVEHHDDIFKRFYRLDESRSSRNVQGTGLGLSIAKAVADNHGYSISLQSTPSLGTTFTLHIPRA